jgi:DNA-binding Lrp family transcriptional regulator
MASTREIAAIAGVSQARVCQIVGKVKNDQVSERRCAYCDKPLERKDRESRICFLSRNTCDRGCRAKLRCAEERELRRTGQITTRKFSDAAERAKLIALHQAQPKLTHSQLAERFGRSRGWVSNQLRKPILKREV